MNEEGQTPSSASGWMQTPDTKDEGEAGDAPAATTPPVQEPTVPAATTPQVGQPAATQPAQQPFPQQQPYAAPVQAPYQQPVYATQPAVSTQASLAKSFSGMLWMTIMLGTILALVGAILLRAAQSQGVLAAGAALGAVGMFLVGFPMLVVGIYHEEWNDRVRTGLMIAGAITVLGIGFF